MTRRRAFVRADRGAAAVELAILLPVVLLILGGIVDFGRFFFTKIELTNAAREGVRAAIVTTGTPGPGATTRALAALPGMATSSVRVTVTACTTGSLPVNAAATVGIANFKWLILEPAFKIIGGPSALPSVINATAVMKCGV